MSPENWEKLNGTGWGDLLCEDANPTTIFDGPPPLAGAALTVEIPAFMYETTQSVLVPASVYRAQGMGRVKREAHRREKNIRHLVNGVFWSLVGFGAFALIVNLADKICG